MLIVEDNESDAEMVLRELRRSGYEPQWQRVQTEAGMLAALEDPPSVIVSDYSMPEFDGLRAAQIAQARVPKVPFILVSGTVGEEAAVEAMRYGASDYLLKDRIVRLGPAVRRALAEQRLRDDHEKMEEARRQSEERIREQADLLDKATEAIVVANLDRRITFWNHGAERLFGWTSAEMIGQTASVLLARVGVAETSPIRHAMQSLDEWRGEVHCVDRAGKHVIIESSLTTIRGASGEPRASLTISSDITARKKLEEQILRTQRLDTLGMLSAGIAHDLNNVLTPILMGVPMLRLRATHSEDLHLLETLERCGERGADLVRQILGFARGVGGEAQSISVIRLLHDVEGVIRETFPKSIVLECHVPRNLWSVRAQPTQMHQVLLNLCVNARDAMPYGGTLRLKAENVSLDGTAAAEIPGARAGSWLAVEVEDTGIGIPPAILGRIWEPFFTTKTAEKGTGLGLATVRGIVETHRGFVTVRSEVGRGTAFRIFIPAPDAVSAADGDARPQNVLQGSGQGILLVDDEKNIREMAAAILVRRGYRVFTASDGLEAIEIHRRHAAEIELVITDLDMPNVDGVALARALNLSHPHLSVLIMSGNAQNRRLGSAAPGAWTGKLIGKPFTADTLLNSVQRHLPAAGKKVAGPTSAGPTAAGPTAAAPQGAA